MRTLTIEASYTKEQNLLRQFFIVVGGSLFLGLFAKCRILLPFTPVPILLQAHLALFLAALFGARLGFFIVLSFLVQGALGLPVFSGGGFGLTYLAGPTGGYLVGYLVAAFVTGYLMERRRDASFSKTFLMLALGNAIVFLFGIAWLSQFIGYKKSLVLGVLPFLPTDMLKLVLFTKLFKVLKRA